MTGRRRWLAALPMLLAAGCGGAAAPAEPGPQRYEVVTTVLESPEHGPELCLSGVAESLPPQCSGVPVANWDWDAAPDAENERGTTWGGDYRLVGTYDGTTFTLTEPPELAPPPEPSPPLRDACTDPQGDEPLARFDRIDKTAFLAAMGRAQGSPDFAGLWVTGMTTSEPGVRFDGMVLNVAFTGDLARHKRELREVWGGLLCVEQHAHTEAALRAAQESLRESADELGLEPLSSSTDVLTGVLELTAVTVTPQDQAAVDERYGEGLVVLIPKLRPLD